MRIPAAATIEEYIANFPASTQTLLKQLRAAVQEAAPKATERISYGMPCFRTIKNLIYFAAYTHHIGFYPGAATIAHFQSQLGPYKHAKGSVQFSLTEPLPIVLIKQMTKFRLGELINKEK
ncbi:MAG: iron chaperone [Sphingobacteriaceae bacterium]